MLKISSTISIPDEEMQFQAIRAQGAGGQNVNKVSSAIHLRFDVPASSLPDFYKERLLALKDRRINSDGVIVIKAQRFRTREKNREDALQRLGDLVTNAGKVQRRRVPTRPTKGSKVRRMDEKTSRGTLKKLRGKVDRFD